MSRHRLEVADVFRNHGPEFMQQWGGSLSIDQRRAFDAIVNCRTKALGGHLEQCNGCGHERNAYNSCRNRSCPKCQALARAKWMDSRAAELLPIPYFHVTFTIPKELGSIALQNQRVVYDILLRAAAGTLQELAADPKHVGAEIGVLSILHTWGQKMDYHVHCHCVVTGGGISQDGKQWVSCKKTKDGDPYFIHEKVISRKFRGKFIDFLKKANRAGELGFYGAIKSLSHSDAFENHLNRAVKHDWVVDVNPPFGRPEQVLCYLARYTNRVAISNDRLITVRDGRVFFWWKDYANDGEKKATSLETCEFIRRFLLHVVPSGFRKIRHSGFMANRNRDAKLRLARELLGTCDEDNATDDVEQQEQSSPDEESEPRESRCPVCRQGIMVRVAWIPAERELLPFRVTTSARPPPMEKTA
jgi:hypothetical protein